MGTAMARPEFVEERCASVRRRLRDAKRDAGADDCPAEDGIHGPATVAWVHDDVEEVAVADVRNDEALGRTLWRDELAVDLRSDATMPWVVTRAGVPPG